MQSQNPALSELVRAYSIFSLIVFAFAVSPLFMPELIGPRWPWPLAPFNGRFVGAVYTGFGWTLVVLAVVNRWAPGRMVLIAALCFTGVLTLVTFFNFGRFDWTRTGTPIWFVVYPASVLVIAFILWSYRGLFSPGLPLTPAWRRFYAGQAAVFCIYGAGLVLLPGPATAFWPWPIDAFHAQLYSAAFFTLGVGAFLIARSTHTLDLLAYGAAQTVLGVTAIAGLYLADAALQRVDWFAVTTSIWIAVFAAIAALGVISLRAAQVRPGKST